MFAEPTEAHEDVPPDAADGTAQSPRGGTLEASAAHRGLAAIEISGKAATPRVLIVVTARKCVVVALGLEELDAPREKVRLSNAGVRVEEDQQIALRHPRTGVARRTRASASLMPQHAQPGIVGEHCGRRIRRAVIDNDEFAPRDSFQPLSDERIEQSSERVGTVMRWND